MRLVLLLWFQGQPLQVWDERDYNDIANNLVKHGQFAFTSQDPASVASTVALAGTSGGPLLTVSSLAAGRAEAILVPRPTSLRPPLYPAFLAAVYSAFGLDNYLAVRVVQMVLSLLTVLVVYALGAEVYDRRIGLAAAGLACFYPTAMAYCNLLLSEVLFTLLLCAACLCVVRFFRRDALAYLVLAGALFGLAALTRSVMWLFPPVLAALILVAYRVPFRRRVAAIVGLAAVFALVLAPWSIRNSRLQRSFVTVDVMGGRNFMMGNYEHTPLYRSWDAIALQGERSWQHALMADLRAAPPVEPLTQGKVDKLAMRHAFQFIRSNPGLTLRRDTVKLVQFWGLERDLVAGAIDGHWGNVPAVGIGLLAALVMGSYVVVLLAGVVGAVAAPPADRRVHWFLLLVLAFVCGLHVLAFSHSRYHLPLMPLVIVYAAAALVQARALWRQGGWRLRLAGAVCALFVGGWLWEIAIVDGHKLLRVFGA